MKARSLAGALALALLSAAGGYGAYRWLETRSPAADEMAPEIVLQDSEGRQRMLSEWRGKLLLVNFWASWCGPCLHEIPLLVKAQEEFGPRGLQIIGPAMDDPEAARAMAQELKINYPIMPGDAEIAKAMEALGDTLGGLPFSVLIAPDGRILERVTGDFKADELRSLILDHLPQSPSP